jgi:hypothetical protein
VARPGLGRATVVAAPLTWQLVIGSKLLQVDWKVLLNTSLWLHIFFLINKTLGDQLFLSSFL